MSIKILKKSNYFYNSKVIVQYCHIYIYRNSLFTVIVLYPYTTDKIWVKVQLLQKFLRISVLNGNGTVYTK